MDVVDADLEVVAAAAERACDQLKSSLYWYFFWSVRLRRVDVLAGVHARGEVEVRDRWSRRVIGFSNLVYWKRNSFRLSRADLPGVAGEDRAVLVGDGAQRVGAASGLAPYLSVFFW